MNCEKIQSVLSEYIDDVLDAAAAAELEAHLEKCSDCRHELEMLRKAVSLLHELPEVEPPADMLKRVRDKLSDEGQAREPLTMTRFFLLPQTRLALAACLVLSVCIYGYRHLNLGRVDTTRSEHFADEPQPTAGPEMEDGLLIVLADETMGPPSYKTQEPEGRSLQMEKSSMTAIDDTKLESERPAAPMMAREAMVTAARPQAAAAPAPAESVRHEVGGIWMGKSKSAEAKEESDSLLMADTVAVAPSDGAGAAKAAPRPERALTFSSTAPASQSRMAPKGMVMNAAVAEPDIAKDDVGVDAEAEQFRTARTNIVVASVATGDDAAVRNLMEEYRLKLVDTQAQLSAKRAVVLSQKPANVIEITVLQEKLPELVQKLRKLGMVTMKTWATNRGERTVTVRVTIEAAPRVQP